MNKFSKKLSVIMLIVVMTMSMKPTSAVTYGENDVLFQKRNYDVSYNVFGSSNDWHGLLEVETGYLLQNSRYLTSKSGWPVYELADLSGAGPIPIELGINGIVETKYSGDPYFGDMVIKVYAQKNDHGFWDDMGSSTSGGESWFQEITDSRPRFTATNDDYMTPILLALADQFDPTPAGAASFLLGIISGETGYVNYGYSNMDIPLYKIAGEYRIFSPGKWSNEHSPERGLAPFFSIITSHFDSTYEYRLKIQIQVYVTHDNGDPSKSSRQLLSITQYIYLRFSDYDCNTSNSCSSPPPPCSGSFCLESTYSQETTPSSVTETVTVTINDQTPDDKESVRNNNNYNVNNTGN